MLRVAIVGSGISGLAAARELAGEHRVTLFEAGRNLGGHTNTIDVDMAGETLAVDTGFIVFNDRTYPGFSAMLRDLGVASNPTAMSFSVQHEATGIEYNGHGLGHLFAQKRNLLRPGFYRMIRGILRLSREAKAWLAERDAPHTPHTPPTAAGRAGRDAGLTLGEFLSRGRYPSEVVEWYIVPMASAVWSAPGAAALRLPFEFFCRFFDNHGFFDMGERPVWRTVAGGSREYVRALAAGLEGRGAVVRTKCPVRWVRRSPGTHRYQQHTPAGEGGVEVVSSAGTERFDAVVIATHSDTALSLLADPAPAEIDVLSALPYQENQAIVHTDARLMPRTRKAWAAWNAHVPREGDGGRAMITYNMNILQGLAPKDGSQVLVTLNNHAAVDPAKTLRLIGYRHPVYTTAGFAAQKRFEEISGPNRTVYAGAYWRYGFHEDGHWSGLRAAGQVRRLAVREQERRA